MAPSIDSRMMQVHPRIKYNTIGGVNGPLVILDNVCILLKHSSRIICDPNKDIAR